MSWDVAFAAGAEKSLVRLGIAREEVFGLIKKSLLHFQGERINIDIKKLRGSWDGFHRIRKGNLRIIVGFDFDSRRAIVEVIDWRGSVYRR